MRLPNIEAILRSRHKTPTLDDIILDLNGAKVFSKCDLKNGYHQLELSDYEDTKGLVSEFRQQPKYFKIHSAVLLND